MNRNEMTYTEVVERRAELRIAMTEVEVMRRKRTVAEQEKHNENLLNEHNRHRKVIEDIESETMKRKADFRNELERINSTATDQQPTPSGDAVITIHKDAEGTPDGVRIQGMGEDFILTLHDAESGENKNYDEWMGWLKENGKTTLTRKQAYLVGMCIDDVNDKLEEAGGDALAADWYTTTDLYIPRNKRSCADYDANNSWCIGGACGTLDGYYRYGSYFRCRPSLAYNTPAKLNN